MNSRKKPGIAFWATAAVVVVLVGYPLSIGPASWASSRFGGGTIVSLIYQPVILASGAKWGFRVSQYCQFFASPGWVWRQCEPAKWSWERF